MNRYCKAGLLLLALFSLTCCKKENFGEGKYPENVVSFTIGNDVTTTKSSSSSSINETQVASYAIEDVDGQEFMLVETVSRMDSQYSSTAPETKGTPIYTENFDTKYGEQVYATAFVPVTASPKSTKLTDVWGSYLENGGTVNLTNTGTNTYSYDYSKGQTVNLAWPDSGELLYFIQAPYGKPNALKPDFYSDGSIEFDYTDPTIPTDVGGRPTIVNGAAAQTDFLFTSKEVSKPEEGGNSNNILMYHALTAVKFKAGNKTLLLGNNPNPISITTINKVTFKGIKANGHCTIVPSYGDANVSPDDPSNKDGAADSKSSSCAKWGKHSMNDNLVVDYSQSFNGIVDYTAANSQFAESFYGTTAESNLVNAEDGGEVMLMVPQNLENVEIVVDFSITVNDPVTGNNTTSNYTRTVKLNTIWNAGELHTYTLTVNKVDVRVDDTMNGSKNYKDNVKLSNTGNVTAYLRAALAIAWYYGYGDDAICVAAYQGMGTFSNGSGPGMGTSWIEGEDGYYYYPWPVLPGYPTQYKLFDSFTAPTVDEEAPFPGAHLEMKVLLQGVQCDYDPSWTQAQMNANAKIKVEQAWGTVHKKGDPNTTVVSQFYTKPERTK